VLPAIQELQQHLTFALNAVVLFRRSPASFPSNLKYLESHRQECTQHGGNIATPDVIKLTAISQDAIAAATAAATTAYTSAASNTTHAATHHHVPKPQRTNAAAIGMCGPYNSRLGCMKTQATCPYKHQCLVCNSITHGKAHCPTFLASHKPKASPTTATPTITTPSTSAMAAKKN